MIFYLTSIISNCAAVSDSLPTVNKPYQAFIIVPSQQLLGIPFAALGRTDAVLELIVNLYNCNRKVIINPITTINFQLVEAGFVTLKAFDICGCHFVKLFSILKTFEAFACQSFCWAGNFESF